MKNILTKTFIYFTLAACLFTSCSKDFINRQPFGSQPTSDAIPNEQALQNALNGAYQILRNTVINGTSVPVLYGRDLPIIGDLQADNTFVEVNNAGRYIPQYQFTFTETDGIYQETWNAAYTCILRCNNVIDADVTGNNVDAIKAQAYALRALMYFRLVNCYARPYTDNPDGMGVPIVLHYDPTAQPARNTVKEVYAQIISDYNKAFATAPDYTNSVTLSKYSIEALLAKAYLYMGDNTNAKAAAVDLINNSGFRLVDYSKYDEFWADPGIHTDQVEVMFEVDADIINNNGFDDFAGMYANIYQDLYCTQDLYYLYAPTDIRISVLIPATTKAGTPAVIVYKFPNAVNTTDRDNIKVIRLAEVYLIAAEASLPGNEDDARNYLNTLAETRDNTFTGYTSSGSQLLDDIVTERRKELAFEGDRYYDLNRLKRDIVRTADPAAIPAPLTIPYSDDRRVAPIPQSELQANPNITQNPGY
jgi:hypothetical protein